MTPLTLIDCLQEYIAGIVKDIILPVKCKRNEEKERCANVYKHTLPPLRDDEEVVPYILLKILSGMDDEQEGTSESTVKVRVIFAVYNSDSYEGTISLMNLIQKVRSELLSTVIVGQRFVLHKPVEYIVYQDLTPPYYMGEMILNFSIPTIERKVNLQWEE